MGSATISVYTQYAIDSQWYTVIMPRAPRVDVGGYVYHVLNRANARAQIFDEAADYVLFERILTECVEQFRVPLLAYCLMPNHWHLVLFPQEDGRVSQFMAWLGNTHTRKWHVAKGTIGQGHLYQGRYKAFLCQQDAHLLTLIRYVERNPVKANLIRRAEDWQWSSAWRREKGTERDRKLLAPWPISIPKDYLTLLNAPQTKEEESALERSEVKGVPFGAEDWQQTMVEKHGLEQTLRSVGRPSRNGG